VNSQAETASDTFLPKPRPGEWNQHARRHTTADKIIQRVFERREWICAIAEVVIADDDDIKPIDARRVKEGPVNSPVVIHGWPN
jgi:hypothetical protein